MEKMAREYQDSAHVYVIYINEAHPSDGWQVPSNEKEGFVLKQPTTMEERRAAAKQIVKMFKNPPPLLIDGLDNKSGKQYSAWPDRIYVINAEGKIAYKGGMGPAGFKPAEAETALKKLLSAK